MVSLAHSYIHDAEKVFENKDFSPLFQSLTLDKVRMTTPRWKRFLHAILDNEAFEDPELLPSLLHLIKHSMQQELSKQTNNFLTELQAILLESDESKQNDSGKSVRGGDHNRRARVNVSVTLPQYDESRGKAAKFVQKFNHLVKTQDFAEQEWDSLLMDCLKKEALWHFKNSRLEFPSHAAYFADLITFFDQRKFHLHYSMRQNEPI